ncbi:MAG TPA: 2-oxoglutarate and iron-dependent oxygenase domain-containing protein [Rhodanobacteraceae bacterium]|nr:2-oxoglutarate and iron-dependent oxygenase domain-containing protein [Rhodanobacteraceae bacterium]
MPIPTLDIRRYEEDRDALVAEVGAAYREFGFCCIAGHGIAPALIERTYAAFRRLFDLPTGTKLRYHMPGGGGARGYTPFGIETAKGAEHADLKEFWHIGRELPPGSKYSRIMAPNLWPAEVPGLREYGYALYQALDALGARVLRILALDLGLPEHWFDERVDCGNSILRPIHYPPIANRATPGLRAGAHEDINLITLLVGASAEGLEVLTRQGEWLPVTTAGDAIVVNIGDMLQRMTNHVYPSTSHRVVNPPGAAACRSRYSVPFFLHANPDFPIEVLPSCIDAAHPNRHPAPITANDYLLERLREIRLL